MTKAQGYFVDYFQFASLMVFDGNDVLKDRIHELPPLPFMNIKFMYLPNEKSHFGSTTGLYPFYGCLNWLFGRTLAPKKG